MRSIVTVTCCSAADAGSTPTTSSSGTSNATTTKLLTFATNRLRCRYANGRARRGPAPVRVRDGSPAFHRRSCTASAVSRQLQGRGRRPTCRPYYLAAGAGGSRLSGSGDLGEGGEEAVDVGGVAVVD